LLFSDVTVDPSSGMITLRAEFPNPAHLLLPGMFVRGVLTRAVNNQALTVPQRGVSISGTGQATVMVVGPDNKAELRSVEIGQAVSNQWVITSGLKAGERVIVDGLQKVQPGMEVKPVPAAAPNAAATDSTSSAFGN
jgi:membrane fusion protein (multidrug efflux system)